MNYKLIDGKLIWEMHATHGLPIEISIPLAAQEHLMPTWMELLYAASDDGAKWHLIIPRLKESICDGYEDAEAQEICARLDLILKKVEEE